jgi:hypothetical protein
VVSQSVLRARTLRIHTNPSGTRRPPLIARDGSRGDSPETRARPALRIDSTPHLGMRKKNLPSPTVFTRRDNSSLSFICRSPAFVDSFGARMGGSHGSLGVPPASTSSHCMRRGLWLAPSPCIRRVGRGSRGDAVPSMSRDSAPRPCSGSPASRAIGDERGLVADPASAGVSRRRRVGRDARVSVVACTTRRAMPRRGVTRRGASLHSGFQAASAPHVSFLCRRSPSRQRVGVTRRVGR